MKRSGVLAACCLLLVAGGAVAGKWQSPRQLTTTLPASSHGGNDSLTANPETLDYSLPADMESAFVWFEADSQTVSRLYIATKSGEWMTLSDPDSNTSIASAADASASVKLLPTISGIYAGKTLRLILNNKHSGTVYGRAWITTIR
jgi:hypothetical protein